ncbi:hypothetical protein B0H11DRAFT_640524 [Mycena galericulata]|nr:hypothetical protein B0H11DRAFT_640524 [Mycena galericulata]
MALARLPPEICAAICSDVEDVASLLNLCRTSRLFRVQAQRLLYHSVDLRGRSMRSIKSWALAVTRHSHLAERVHTLALQLPGTVTLDASDATKIGRALNKCVNLKDLKISGEVYANGSRPRSLHGWMINESPFRLVNFENSYFDLDWIQSFWKLQSEIRILSFPHFFSRFPFSPEELPNLIAVAGFYVQDLPVGRPLQRIQMRLYGNLSLLAQYARTLSILNLLQEGISHVSGHTLSGVLVTIADSLPNLVHLGIAEQKREVHGLFPPMIWQ